MNRLIDLKDRVDDFRQVQECLDDFRIENLPSEMILKIFSYLNVLDLGRCSLVNRQWSLISNDKTLWLKLLKKHEVEDIQDLKKEFVASISEMLNELSKFSNHLAFKKTGQFVCHFAFSEASKIDVTFGPLKKRVKKSKHCISLLTFYCNTTPTLNPYTFVHVGKRSRVEVILPQDFKKKFKLVSKILKISSHFELEYQKSVRLRKAIHCCYVIAVHCGFMILLASLMMWIDSYKKRLHGD